MTDQLQSVRNTNLMSRATSRATSGASAIASLKTQIGLMREIALKAHKNTSGDVDENMLVVLQEFLDEAVADLPSCLEQLGEMAALRDDPMLVDSLIAKYNFNEAAYDKGLERGK